MFRNKASRKPIFVKLVKFVFEIKASRKPIFV